VTEGNNGNPSMTFTVTLSSASSQTVTVNYATANGTATAGSDYTTTSGTLSFSPGQTSHTVSVTTLGDFTPEANETFFVNLSNPTNATIADAQGLGTIQDNDGTMTVTAPNTTVNWGIATVHTISWSNNLGSSARVNIELSRNGGSTWESIAANVANTSASGGSYNWTVTGPTTTSARVRVTWTLNPNVTDTSNSNFTISSASVSLTSPNGGNLWFSGTIATVTWGSNLSSADAIKIELSRDGGTTFPTVLASSTSNDGSYNVFVQSAWRTSQARVRVSWAANAAVNDTSNSNFTIL
jgi:hypothetical protein